MPTASTRTAVTLAIVVLLGACGGGPGIGRGADRPVVLYLSPPDAPVHTDSSDQGGQIAISPDGSTVVYPAGVGRLMLRDLGRIQPRELVDRWGARDAFFSPDGAWVGFFAGLGMLRAPVAGGPPEVLVAELPGHAKGACWTGDQIIYSPASNEGLWRVPASGGRSVRVTTPDAAAGELSHRWPHALPDGRGVLFTVKTQDIETFDDARIAVLEPATGTWRTLVEGGSFARYAPSGHLLYARGGKLLAVPFDLATLGVPRGADPVVVVDDLRTQNVSGAAMYGLGRDGTLVYMTGGPTEARQELVWVDRRNDITLACRERRAFLGEVTISPDGRRVALPAAGANDAVWIYDVQENDLWRMPFARNCGSPVWSAGGRAVCFLSDRDGHAKVFTKELGGAGAVRELYDLPDLVGGFEPRIDLTADGEWLAVAKRGDIVLVNTRDAARTRVLAATRDVDELRPVFAPGGRHIAYVVESSGSGEIYVRALDGGEPVLVARSGGSRRLNQPRWSPDGTRLYYLSEDAIFSVPITLTPVLGAGAAEKILLVGGATGFCPHPDGQRFLVCRRPPERAVWAVRVVLRWTEDLARRVPR